MPTTRPALRILGILLAVAGTLAAPRVAQDALHAEHQAAGIPDDLGAAAEDAALPDTSGQASPGPGLRANPLAADQLLADARAFEASGQHGRALTVARLAARVTHRNFPARVWALEQALANGALAEALREYDAILTIWPASRDRLIGQLVGAAATEPAIRTGLLRYSARPWFGDFLKQALQTDAALDFLPHLRRFEVGKDERLHAQLLGEMMTGLLAAGQLDALQRLVGADPAIPPGLLRTIDFTAGTTDERWGRLAWRLSNSIDAQLQWNTENALELELSPETEANVLQRFTLFAPGRYQFRVEAGHYADYRALLLRWQIDCPPPGPAEPAQTLASELLDAGRERVRDIGFAIPANCPVQRWTMRAISNIGNVNARAFVSRISLARIGA